MLKNIFYKKRELEINNDYIDKKRKDIEMKKQEIKKEMEKWGKKQSQRKNFL